MKEVLKAILPIKDKLYRYALRIVGNEMTAEDVVQEVLIKVWQKKSDLEKIENKEAWCMTVTRNLALDKLRRKKVIHDNVDDHRNIADNGMTPYRSLQSDDTMGIIQHAMSQLPESQQQVIHLRDVEGYSYQEIADITGYSLDKVKVYLHRARITLRHKLTSIYA